MPGRQMSLMKRIEDLVCIPLMYWVRLRALPPDRAAQTHRTPMQRLACGREVLDPAALTITHPHFLKASTVGEWAQIPRTHGTEPDRRCRPCSRSPECLRSLRRCTAPDIDVTRCRENGDI